MENKYLVWRKQLNFTQDQMADSLGVTLKTYRGWETGRRVPKDEYRTAQKERFGSRPLTFHWWSKRRARYPHLFARADGYRGTGYREGPWHPRKLLRLPDDVTVTLSVLDSAEYKDALRQARGANHTWQDDVNG